MDECVVDGEGRKKAVVIDLNMLRALCEDMCEALEAKEREHEALESHARVKMLNSRIKDQ
jgi:hypothetical protein